MRVYALKNTDEIRKKSSSGGAFTAIAEAFFKVYEEKSIVYGVCFDSDMVPHYCGVNSIEQCEIFYGSKYIQPKVGDVFLEIEKQIKDGKSVLFTGLPCHVYALKSTLKAKGIDDSNLLLVDLICNGVPDLYVWKNYVDYIEKKYNSRLIDFKFRHKGDSLNPYRTAAFFDDGKTVIDSHLTASYNRLYLKKIIIRKACFSCPFKHVNRNGDITIGDFWGIEKYNKSINDGRGVSLVISSSQKGDQLIGEIDESIELVEFDKSVVCSTQENIKEKTKLPDNYEFFWEDYNQGTAYVMKKYADAGFGGMIKHICRHFYRRVKRQ